MVGKLAQNSSHLTSGLVKYVPSRGYFCAVPCQSGDKYVTSPPPKSSNLSHFPRSVHLTFDEARLKDQLAWPLLFEHVNSRSARRITRTSTEFFLMGCQALCVADCELLSLLSGTGTYYIIVICAWQLPRRQRLSKFSCN